MTTPTPWLRPPDDVTLRNDEVHVWRAMYAAPDPEQVQSLWHTLDADERRRAERFHFQTDRDHFIFTRGLLRTILGRYLSTEPRQIRFRYHPNGKPALTQEAGPTQLHFNLAHSHGMALFALTRARRIGVDVERIRGELAAAQIARRFFSAREATVLLGLPAHQQPEAFFRCWTRKEAYIKAVGDGLSLPLDQFEVSLAPDEPAALLAIQGDTQAAARWTLRELAPGDGFVAAVAVEGRSWQLFCWQNGPPLNKYR